MVADIRLDREPASTAFRPNLAMVPRRFGAMEPRPPSRMATEDRLAKPHRAKEMMALVCSGHGHAADQHFIPR